MATNLALQVESGFRRFDTESQRQADWLQEAAASYWLNHPRQRRFARFITARPGPSRRKGETKLMNKGIALRLCDELRRLGVQAAFGAYTNDPSPHIHLVFWPNRKWRHDHIRSILHRVGLEGCGNPKRATQKVNREPKDGTNAALWQYLANHVSNPTGRDGQAIAFVV